MVLVDSSVLIDYFNGIENWQVNKLDEILSSELIIIADYVLIEVLQGFKNDKDYIKAKTILETFPCLSICGKEIAIKSSENFRSLRKKGITIRKTIDVIISTFCIENDVMLLHNDKDFQPFENHLGLNTIKYN